MSKKRLKCIELANERKFKTLESQRQNLKIKTNELKIKWEPCLKGKVFQIVLMPILFPTLLLFIIFDYYYTAIKLNWKIRTFKYDSALKPNNNSFYNLWKQHGLDKNYSDPERLDLLEQWISILYPERQSDMALIKEKRRNADNQESETQHSPHHSLIDEIGYLIKQLDLPDYES